MTENNGIKSRTWSALSAGAFLIAIALAIVLFWYTGDFILTFGIFLVVFGAYMVVSSFGRKGNENGFGPSEADATLAGGAVIAGVGATCLIWGYTGEVLLAVAALIVIVAVIGIIMAIKNRSY